MLRFNKFHRAHSQQWHKNENQNVFRHLKKTVVCPLLIFALLLPFQKLQVFSVFHQTSSHHNRLETMAIYCPQSHSCCGWKGMNEGSCKKILFLFVASNFNDSNRIFLFLMLKEVEYENSTSKVRKYCEQTKNQFLVKK